MERNRGEKQMLTILHGNILYSKNYDELFSYEDSYIVSENGRVEGIYFQKMAA